MTKNHINSAEANINMLSPDMLRRLDISLEEMRNMLESHDWGNIIETLSEEGTCTAEVLLARLMPVMNELAAEPEGGWLSFICRETTAYMFPDNFTSAAGENENRAMKFFLESYRMILRSESENGCYSPVDTLQLLSEKEISDCTNADEYRHLKDIWKQHYLFEFMRINREITPFNTIGHIGGVHHVAVFIGRQLVSTDIPIDISLVSGAAACHDLGKFGCRPEEASRVPYLHYYYTDRFLTGEYMPMIAHIASNHSTWDLELENLSIESLILIYADFRVKSVREKGIEKVCFYTLDESFQVILDKLDNVDQAKRQRYERVYAKLKDFEGYLRNLGVTTDIFSASSATAAQSRRNPALLSGNQVVEELKYTAIEHNIKIMSIFNNESSFGSLIEAARSDRQWKNQRAYIDILNEYHSYMTKQEKTLTLAFLYDLLAHREGDIRRQAGNLLGTIIATYDDVYRKEIPAAVNADVFLRSDSLDVWEDYMNKIVFPDYKITDRHRSWIGYAFKAVMTGLFDNLGKDKINSYVEKYVELFRNEPCSESATFTLLNSVSNIGPYMLQDDDRTVITEYALAALSFHSTAVKVGALRAVEHMTRFEFHGDFGDRIISAIDDVNAEEFSVSINYIKYEICRNLGMKNKAAEYLEKAGNSSDSESGDDSVSMVLRENLKVGTPWVVKAANIDYLMQFADTHRDDSRMYHLATHFSNLIKVSEIVTVRRRAGISLIGMAQHLHIDQINEIVIELSKGLEIGEYQFSKYIPEFLGQLALFLYPSELDEFIVQLSSLIESDNDKVGSVALDTVGEILSRYSTYRYRNKCGDENYEDRRHKLLGMLLKGLANYHDAVSQEAFMVLGKFIFGNPDISGDEKFYIFKSIYKKMLTLITAVEEYDMNFFNNAAALNHIYRFISEYEFKNGFMKLPRNDKIAFFPGTFDPFSLSHKGIVQAIRDEGFEVYLALDEFSWSKRTQARQLRRIIITMSVADEPDVFMFPDDFPVNIANPQDLINLRCLFPDKQVYMVVGSDVITNASSYNKEPEYGSIHSMNHIVFRRESQEQGDTVESRLEENYSNITGSVIELKLPMHLEDISSTRIRDNIDQGRDISNLIDPVAQNFIYDNSLYLREPQYKNILEMSRIRIEPLMKRDGDILANLEPELIENGLDIKIIREYINKDYVKVATVEDMDGSVIALAAVNTMETSDLYREFGDMRISGYLRRKVTGRMLVIRGIYCNRRSDMDNLVQIISTEVISQALKEDITYAIYHPVTGGINRHIRAIIERMGFTEIVIDNKPEPIFEVSMKEPMAVIQNLDTALKSPFNSNPRILEVLQSTHGVLQKAITKLNPGNLVLSFNEGVLNEKIVDMVTKTNGVPNYPVKPRVLGDYMCVPFGKTLRNSVVPNTVTKTLHTEKVYSPTLDSFTIEEYPKYATLNNQIRTIKSFNRPVILVDDLLHNGYRLQKLDPFFKENDIKIAKIITGLLSGNGKDLMDVQGRDVESAYFVPNLKAWFIETGLCPFIGGDGIRTEDKTSANLIPSINQLLPFAAMSYLDDCPRDAIYELSYVCIDNAIKIFKVLEDEYQEEFERKLTIKRLSDAVIGPRMPNGANRVAVNFNLAPSVYMADYMMRLLSLESAFK